MLYSKMLVENQRENAAAAKKMRGSASAKAQFVKKVLINDGAMSGKARAKLLAKMRDSNFDLGVSYSLNRKYRWEHKNAEGFLNHSDDPEHLEVTGIDAAITAQAIKCVGMHDRNPDGTIDSTTSAFMAPTDPDVEQLVEVAKKHKKAKNQKANPDVASDDVADAVGVCYVVGKPGAYHPAAKSAMSVKKFRRSGGSARVPIKDAADNDDEIDFFDGCEEEADMSASMAALYGAKRGNFALGDFISDTGIDEESVIVPTKSIESIGVSTDSDSSTKHHQPAVFIHDIVDHESVQETNDCLFEEFVISSDTLGTNSLVESCEALVQQDSRIKVRWLNSENTYAIVDVSNKLDDLTTKLALVITVEQLKSKIGFLRVLLNGSFKCPKNAVELIKMKTYSSLVAFISEVVSKMAPWYREDHGIRQHAASNVELNSIYHSHLFVRPVEPFSQDKIMESYPQGKAVVVGIQTTPLSSIQPPANTTDDSLDSEDDEEFEVIDMESVISDDEDDVVKSGEDVSVDADAIEFIEAYDAGCDQCGESDIDELVVLDACAHRFCRRCISDYLVHMFAAASSDRVFSYPVSCLHDNCFAPISFSDLPAFVPLNAVAGYLTEAFILEQRLAGKTAIQCPQCFDYASSPSDNKLDAVKCSKCSIAFCATCHHQPHFPLTCKQSLEWSAKFDKQFALDVGRQHNETRKCPCGQVLGNDKGAAKVTCAACNVTYNWKSGEALSRKKTGGKGLEIVDFTDTPNNIAAEYSEVCSGARSARFNLACNRQMAKNMRKVDYKMRLAFVEIRKAALHLIEFGSAWLYMTRSNKSDHWNAIRQSLTTLRAKLDAMHCSIEKSKIDATIDGKITELNSLVVKLRDDLAGSQGSSSTTVDDDSTA